MKEVHFFIVCAILVFFGGYIICALNAKEFTPAPSSINGSTELQDASFESLKVNGNLKYRNLQVTTLQVNGSLQGSQLVCDTMKVNGFVNVQDAKIVTVASNGSFKGENVQVKDKIVINGSLDVNNITVLGNIEVKGKSTIKRGTLNQVQIAGKLATFENSTINHITIKKANNSWDINLGFFSFTWHGTSEQVIELKAGTIVSGDIVFESGEGEVRLFDTSEVKGTVKGGKIVRR